MVILGVTKSRILEELSRRDLHGYELARKVGIPVTGIYQHLRELSADGLISHEIVGRRKTFSLTTKGRRLIELILAK